MSTAASTSPRRDVVSSDQKLAFGCVKALPEGVTTAWGARWIWPNDFVWDRQDLNGPNAEALRAWLNEGALKAAREAVGSAGLDPTADRTAVLFEDERGKIVANPQASYGHL